jgi:hypothetical protein
MCAPASRPLASAHMLHESDLAPAPPSPLAEAAAHLHQAQMLDGQRHRERPMYRMATPRASALDLLQQYPWLILGLAGACLAIILLLSPATQPIVSSWTGPFSRGGTLSISAPQPPANIPPGQHAVIGAATVDAALIDAVLTKYGSPAAGTGRVWIEMGQRYGLDPAYALAFFIHESSAGTNPGWAGLKPGGGTTHNIGNIICAGYPTCFGRFRDYASWEEGIEDWYKLINREYVGDRGVFTVEQIIPIYAPSFENDVPNYVNAVVSLVESWQHGVIQ